MTVTSGQVSAISDQLMRYADAAKGMNGYLEHEARLLRATLDRFALSCTEYNTGVGPQLADDLRAYVQRIAPTDEWVRQVGIAFRNADQGQMAAGEGEGARPDKPPQQKKKKSFWDKLGEWEDRFDEAIHTALDVAGMVPVVGEFADAANALYYAAEGDYTNAALSAAGMIPLVGGAAVGVRLAYKAAKHADEAVDITQTARRVTPDNMTNIEKGLFGERKADKYMERLGYDKISRPMSPGQTGIDGVYKRNGAPPGPSKVGESPKWVVGEAKYGSAGYGQTKSGKQMSQTWVDDRLDDAVGERQADLIRNEGYERWELRVNSKGDVAQKPITW